MRHERKACPLADSGGLVVPACWWSGDFCTFSFPFRLCSQLRRRRFWFCWEPLRSVPLPSASSAIDAEHTIETFGARLRNEVELDALASGLVAVVDRTMTPAHVSLDHPGATDMTTEGLTRRQRRLRVGAWVLLAFTIGLIVASEILGRVSDTPRMGDGWRNCCLWAPSPRFL